ncbi:hypothetical protein [Rossellomorea marisflavi]
MFGVDWELIHEFEGGVVYWISWTANGEIGGKMVTLYDEDVEGEDDGRDP